MKWNWQQRDWPQFEYDEKKLKPLEEEFLRQCGVLEGSLKFTSQKEHEHLLVEIISSEAKETSEIEGIQLNRDSLRSSIQNQFGLKTRGVKVSDAEKGVSDMMVDLYRRFSMPLSKEILCNWYRYLMSGKLPIKPSKYRTYKDAMQVVSGPVYQPKVHFEAPPSNKIHKEMTLFLNWFNGTAQPQKQVLPVLTRAALSHLWFVCIHPFEDGNGRIGRAVAEKSLAQSLGRPTMIALAKTINMNKKQYSDALSNNNQQLEITDWMIYFSRTILDAQQLSQRLIDFSIKKMKFFDSHKDDLNDRQAKVVERIFREGPDGFEGGLSAQNYISISKTSRATATRDLQDLVTKKIFTKKGELKHTRYYLTL